MFAKTKEQLHREMPAFIKTCEGMIENSKDGIDIDVEKHKKKRNTLQNSFMWVNLNNIADFLNDSGLSYEVMNVELPFNKDIIHEINAKVFGVKTTTKMTVTEFCEYMDKMFYFWQERTEFEWIPLESTRGYLERTGLINNKEGNNNG